MRAPITSGVRLLVALNVSYMVHLWPLMLQRLVRFVGNSFFGTQPLIVFQGTDLSGFAGHNLVVRPSLNLAVCPSAACSPPLSAKVPHAIDSSRAVLRRPRFTGVSRHAIAQAITACCLSNVTLNIQATAGHCIAAKSRHNGQQLFGGRPCFLQSNSRQRQTGSNPLPLRATA